MADMTTVEGIGSTISPTSNATPATQAKGPNSSIHARAPSKLKTESNQAPQSTNGTMIAPSKARIRMEREPRRAGILHQTHKIRRRKQRHSKLSLDIQYSTHFVLTMPPVPTEFSRLFNQGEAALWFAIAIVILIRLRAPLKLANTFWRWLLPLAFVVFGVSDLIEAQTGAWWHPWWLLVMKAACVLCFLLAALRYRGKD